MRHKKIQESIAIRKGKNQSIETVSKEPQMDLLNKDFIFPVLNMLKELRKPCLKN